MRPMIRRFLPALVAGTAAVIVTAACGGSDGDGGGATGADTGQNAMTAYVECMRTNGVALTLPTGRPDGVGPSGRPGGWPSGSPGARPSGMPSGRPSGAPGGGGRQMFAKPDGVDQAVWDKAVQACQSVRPTFGAGGRNGGGPGGTNGGSAGANGALAAYQNCLKEHGVPTPAQADAANSTVASALAACKVLSPAPESS